MKKAARKARSVRSKAISKRMVVSPVEGAFDEIVELIRAARQQAARAVNTQLIDLYWRIGDYLHHKIESDGLAQGTVVHLAAYIAQREPGLRGFSPQNLWRMRQFFAAYRDDPKLSTALRELHPTAASHFKDAYLLAFLALPGEFSEADLHQAPVRNLGRFLTAGGLLDGLVKGGQR